MSILLVGLAVKARRDEYKELTRAAVLEAAAANFADRGYAATTIDEIALAARVSKGAVYHHFADKAAVFEAVFREGQVQLLENVAAAAAPISDPWERLDSALRAYLDGTISDHRHRALLQQAPAALGVERCRQIDEDLGLPLLRHALVDLADRNDLAADQPIDLLARVLFSALCQAAMSAGADPHPDRARGEAAYVLAGLTSGLRRHQPRGSTTS